MVRILYMKSNNSTIDPNNIAWEINNAKRHNDLRIYNALKYDFIKKKHINCLSFPAKNWFFEKGMAMSFMDGCTFMFDGIERNIKVLNESMYTKKKKTIDNATYKFNNMNPISAHKYFIQYSGPTKYDFIYLDWMGTWSKEKKKELESMFVSDILKKNSYFGFTIMLSRGQPITFEDLEIAMEVEHSTTYDFDVDDTGPYKESHMFKLKTHGLTNLLITMAKSYGYGLRLKLFSLYSGGTGFRITPELSFLFKVDKL